MVGDRGTSPELSHGGGFMHLLGRNIEARNGEGQRVCRTSALNMLKESLWSSAEPRGSNLL